ncbi:hypothetical protein D3C76_1533310 [compost metagenome]
MSDNTSMLCRSLQEWNFPWFVQPLQFAGNKPVPLNKDDQPVHFLTDSHNTGIAQVSFFFVNETMQPISERFKTLMDIQLQHTLSSSRFIHFHRLL